MELGRHAFSGFSVDDIAKAQDFYGQTLGLDVSELPDMGLLNSPSAMARRSSSIPKKITNPRPLRFSTFPSTTSNRPSTS